MREEKILELKDDGHRIIKTLVYSGMDKDTIYKKLANMLNVRDNKAHFASMRTSEEIERAISMLRIMENDAYRKFQRKRDKELFRMRQGIEPKKILVQLKKQKLSKNPAPVVFEELKRRNTYNILPWYKKLWLSLTGKDGL